MPTTKSFRFEPDEKGIFNVSNGDAVKGVLTQRASDAAKQIRKLAPSGRSFFDYRKNVKVRPAKKVGTTVEAAVEVDTPGWHLPEYGTAIVQPTAPIRRGVRLAGLDFREGE